MSGMVGLDGLTWIINQVLNYCSEFCNHLDVEFDSSIVLTGVAATLIGGETIDSAARLCKKNTAFDEVECQEWKKTRLLIMDEISFMATSKLIKLDNDLERLRKK